MVAQIPQLRAIPGGKTGELTVTNDLESLYRAHHDRVFRLAYRVTGNLMDAEDVLQTVFLRLSRRETVDLEPNPASYLNRAAINASLDLLRQRGRSPLVQIDDLSTLPVGSGQLNPEATQASQELRETIRRAITHLGEKSAAMFVLKYFEGYGNQEIAELMGTSSMVVGVVLHRARARVRRELGDYIGNLTEVGNQEKEGDR